MENRELLQRMRYYGISLRYLRPIQIYARIGHLLRRRVLDRWPRFRSRYARPLDRPGPIQRLDLPLRVDWLASRYGIVSDGKFTFLNVSRDLGWPPRWFPDDVTQLWLYNLHYFEYAPLLALGQNGYEHCRALIQSWIKDCPVGRTPAWDPYPTALRIRSWIKVYILLADELALDSEFACEFQSSLRTQLRFLESHLEYHLLGNHLLEDGCALLMGGLFFADREAERWRIRGEKIVREQVEVQVLGDGGHDERSPMYHLLMLALLEETAQALGSRDGQSPAYLNSAIERMRAWAVAMRHPDGEIALFNDAAFDIVAPLEAEESEAPASGFQALAESGYFVFRHPNRGDTLLADCGPLGPDHQPGHGHCDALSFELSVGGHRLIIDSGVESYYADLEWRHYYRSTRAHNTIVVDGAEQSEIWSRFRVANRARTQAVWSDSETLSYLCGSHDGYTRLADSVVHRRWFAWIDQRFWIICDLLTGSEEHEFSSYLHFHPDANARIEEGTERTWSGSVVREDAYLRLLGWGAGPPTVERGRSRPIQGWYAPRFGCRRANDVWQISVRSRPPLWLCLVLWPDDSSVEAAWEASPDRCQANVKSDSHHYQIEFDADYQRVERVNL